MQPLFTIGIPTYNRAALLREALQSALLQTYEHIEVLVSDNASVDSTEAVVQSFSDSRIRYFRQKSNIGSGRNFEYCVENARGRYFSWLQDDDIIFSDFVEKAVRTMQLENASCYLATCTYAENPRLPFWTPLYSPPIEQDWVTAKPMEVPFNLMLPLSLFVSVGVPPVAAFRTKELLEVKHWISDSDFPLYAERVMLADLAKVSRVYIAPHLAGVFRRHESQYSVNLQLNTVDVSRQYKDAGLQLEVLSAGTDFTIDNFKQLIARSSESLLKQWSLLAEKLVGIGTFCDSVRAVLDEECNRRNLEIHPGPSRRSVKGVVKTIIRELCPPVLMRQLRTLSSHLRS
jgi:glycosyltransferase involved in cell wall biosynthesis